MRLEEEARKRGLKLAQTAATARANVPSLLDFTTATYRDYEPGAVHRLICQRLEAFLADVEAGGSPRLIITVPPRHGKSELASVRFPAYVLGKHPDWPIIHASYSSDLSNDFSRQVRSLLRDEVYQGYFPGVLPSRESRSVERWGIEGRRGVFVSVGVGGPITGRGAKIAIIDDPLKNAEAADSEVVRKSQRDWYDSTLYTRCDPGGAGILLVLTRWHTDDLGGYVLTGAGSDGPATERWSHIHLPALAEGDDALGRLPGAPLWPERFTVDDYQRIETTVRPRWWAALYQQRPVKAEGNLLEIAKIRHAEIHPAGADREMLSVYQAWDLAITSKSTGDYSACATVGIDGDQNAYLLHVLRERMSFNETMAAMEEQAAIWKPRSIGIETTGYQAAAFQEASRRFMLPFREVKPSKDKVTRAQLLADRISMGKVFANKAAAWWQVFEGEAMSFPQSSHDDQVDAVVHALSLHPANWESLMEPLRPPRFSPDFSEWEDEQREREESVTRLDV